MELIDFKDVVQFDLFFQVYLILMVLDFITGFLKAFKTEGFKSRKIREGVIRVLGEIIAIFVGGVLSILLNIGGIALGIKALFIFKEAISVFENLGVVGVYIPKWILTHLEEFKNQYNPLDKDNNDKDDIDEEEKLGNNEEV